tara:strand:+ start:1499 stop:2521 length:1023 start_codon:yes stop_codon:yes gene_type:complete
MFFPNAEIVMNPFLLVGLGLIVGTLSGFFGIGGGFLITGSLLVLGVPPLFAVGTGITLVMGTAIISTLKHRQLGNVDLKFGFCLICGTVPAVYIAEKLNQILDANNIASPVIQGLYFLMLCGIGIFITADSIRNKTKGDVTNSRMLLRNLKFGPKFVYVPGLGKKSLYWSFPIAGIESMSVLVIIIIGFCIGFMAGLLGAGGGFIMMPVLIYLVGLPTTVAIGTDLLQVIVTGSLGTFLYSLSGNVDVLMAIFMLIPAFFLSQIGALATKFVDPSRIRAVYGLLLIVGGVAVGLEYLSGFVFSNLLSYVAIITLLGFSACVSIWILLMCLKGLMTRSLVD